MADPSEFEPELLSAWKTAVHWVGKTSTVGDGAPNGGGEDAISQSQMLAFLSSQCLETFRSTGTTFQLKGAFCLALIAVFLDGNAPKTRLHTRVALADVLAERFESYGLWADICKAIELLETALEHSADTDSSVGNALTCLMIYEEVRFKATSELGFMENAVYWAEKATQLPNTSNSNRGIYFHNLGDKLVVLYRETGRKIYLDRGLAAASSAVSLVEPDHFNRAGYLNNLSTFLSKRATLTKSESDADEALETAREALRCSHENDHRIPFYINNLGLRLASKFSYSQNEDHIDEAIQYASQLVTPTGQGPNDYLSNLGAHYHDKYNVFARFEDLNMGIKFFRHALQQVPEFSSDYSGIANNLGLALEKSYGITQDNEDLEEAIELLRLAVQTTKEISPERGHKLDSLSRLIAARFRRSMKNEDMEEAIELAREAVAAPTYEGQGVEDRWSLFSNLAVALAEAFTYESTMDMSNVDRAYSLALEALDHIPNVSKARSVVLNNMACVLQHKMSREGSQEVLKLARDHVNEALENDNLEPPIKAMLLNNYALYGELQGTALPAITESLELVERSIQLAKESRDKELPRYLDHLASLKMNRFSYSNAVADIESACNLSEAVIEQIPRNRPSLLAMYRHNASQRYIAKANSQFGTSEDIERALFLAEAAIEATPSQHYLYVRYMREWAAAYAARWERSRDLSDLRKAIEVNETTLGKIPDNHPRKQVVVGDLGLLYMWLYEALKNPEALATAFQFAEENVTLDRTHYSLNDLAILWGHKYKASKEIQDLDKCIELSKETVEMTDENYWEYSGFLRNLADSYQTRYLALNLEDDYSKTISTLEKAYTIKSARPRSIIQAAQMAAKLHAQKGELGKASEALEQAVNQIPLTRQRYFGRDDEQHVAAEYHNLASDAAVCALAAGKSSYEALKLLELGHAGILGSLVDCRTDISALREQHLDLYEELEATRRELDAAPFDSSQAFGEDDMLDAKVRASRNRRQDAAKRFEELLATIRQLPSFEDFLSLPSEPNLRKLADDGPIVVLINGMLLQRGYVVIVTTDSIKALCIDKGFGDGPLKPEMVKETIIIEKDIYKGVLRTMKKRNEVLRNILQNYWTWVMKPLCQELGFEPKTNIEDLPHIWLVRAGYPYNILPMHAVGDFSRGSTENTFNHFIASYTPSIKTLMYARERPFNFLEKPNAGLLVATMETTPGHKPLDGVGLEASALVSLAKQTDIDVQLLSQPTAGQVLSSLSKCTAAHFACHGSLGTIDPSASSLIFEKPIVSNANAITNGHQSSLTTVPDPLSVRSISISNHQASSDMQLAYLSACASAGSDNQRLTNEAIHMAGSLLLAGFSHVIGTLWPADDDICVEIATQFWSHLLAGKGVEESMAQRRKRVRVGLWKAVEKVRREYWDQPLFWASYVHFGA